MEKLYAPGDALKTDADFDHASETLIVKRTQDVEPILEHNKAGYDVDAKRFGGDFHQVASIPLVVVEQWMAEGINIFDANHAPAIRRKLNSNEYRYLRTRPGRI